LEYSRVCSILVLCPMFVHHGWRQRTMETVTEQGARVIRFWQNYLQVLDRYKVPETARPWYRKRIEAYIKANAGRRLATHGPGDVTAWVELMGRNVHLTPWQFRQTVDALCLLFAKMLAVDWAGEVNWDGWKSTAQVLPPDHPAIARSTAEMKQGGALAAKEPAVYCRFIAAVRVSDYATTTERIYLRWVNAFLRFHNGHSLAELSELDVRSLSAEAGW
jgi:hypothetical protein